MSAFQKFEYYSNEPFQAQNISGSQILASQSSTKRENVVVNLVDDEEDQTFQALAKKSKVSSSSTLPRMSTKKPAASNSTENLAPNPTSEIGLSSANTSDPTKPLEELQLFPTYSKATSKTSTSAVVKAKSTIAAATTTKKASNTSAKAKAGIKGRILKELEKLTPQDRIELLNELSADSVVSITSKLDGQSDRDVAEEGDGKSPTSKDLSVDETELMKMRLELGEILNRESELRAKEKKLRTNIKKLQRKVSLAYEIPYEIREDSLEQILARLFQLSEPHPWERSEEESVKPRSNNDLHISCPLWYLAQQHEDSSMVVEDKRLDVERDATIRSPLSQPSQSSKFTSSTSIGAVVQSPAKKDGPSILSQMIAAIDSSESLISSSQVQVEVEKDDYSSPKLLSFVDSWASLVASNDDESSLQTLSTLEDMLTCSRRDSDVEVTNKLESQDLFQQLSSCYLHWKQNLKLKEEEKAVAKILWMDLMDQMMVNAKISIAQDKVDKGYCFGILMLLQRMLRDVSDIEPNHHSITEDYPVNENNQYEEQAICNQHETFDIYENMSNSEDVVVQCQKDLLHQDSKMSHRSQIHKTDDNYEDLISSGDHAPMIGVKRVFSNTMDEPICLFDDQDHLTTEKKGEDSHDDKSDEDIIILEPSPKKQKLPTSSSSSSQIQNSQAESFDYSQAQSMSLFERLTQMREKHRYEKANSSLPKDPLTSSVEPAWHLYNDQQITSIADQYGLMSNDSSENLRKLLKSMWKSMNQDVAAAGSSVSRTHNHIAGSNDIVNEKKDSKDATIHLPGSTQTKPISKNNHNITSSQNSKALKRTELTKALFKDFLKRHLDIYQDILMFIPVCLDVVHARLLQDNIKVHKKELLAFLDQEAIFVAMRKPSKSISSKQKGGDNNQDDEQRTSTEVEEDNDDDDDGDTLSQEEESYE